LTLAAIQSRDKIGPLAVGRWQVARRDEAAAQQALLVFAVEQDDLHDQILVLAQQHANARVTRPFVHGKPLPLNAVPAQGVQGLVQPGQEVLFDLVKFGERRLIRPPEGLAFTFHDGKEFLAEGEMLAEVACDVFRGTYCAATGAAGWRLVALDWNN